MICGTKADIEKLIPYVSDELAAALRYIAKTDFSKLADGEYPIDGDKVFARLSHYTTEPKEAKKPESHNQYIDVQYLAEGTEKIYYTAKDADKKVIEDYAADKDLLFYADAGCRDARQRRLCRILPLGAAPSRLPCRTRRLRGPEDRRQGACKIRDFMVCFNPNQERIFSQGGLAFRGVPAGRQLF